MIWYDIPRPLLFLLLYSSFFFLTLLFSFLYFLVFYVPCFPDLLTDHLYFHFILSCILVYSILSYFISSCLTLFISGSHCAHSSWDFYHHLSPNDGKLYVGKSRATRCALCRDEITNHTQSSIGHERCHGTYAHDRSSSWLAQPRNLFKYFFLRLNHSILRIVLSLCVFVFSCPIIYFLVLSYLILSLLNLSCLPIFRLVTSDHDLSKLILSYYVFPFFVFLRLIMSYLKLTYVDKSYLV